MKFTIFWTLENLYFCEFILHNNTECFYWFYFSISAPFNIPLQGLFYRRAGSSLVSFSILGTIPRGQDDLAISFTVTISKKCSKYEVPWIFQRKILSQSAANFAVWFRWESWEFENWDVVHFDDYVDWRFSYPGHRQGGNLLNIL